MICKTSSVVTTLLLGIICFISSGLYGQNKNNDSITKAYDSAMLVWLKDLYEPGVKVTEDSIQLNKETERLLKDAAYRQVMYPAVYTWEEAKNYIQKQEIKKALWFFINLYLVSDQNKELVIKSLLIYDKVFKIDKVLVSSFYTYSFTDPEIGSIEGGHSKITAPHIMEKKLNALKAMLFYVEKYRLADKKDTSKNP